MEDMKRQLAEYKRKEANREREEKKAKSAREGIREKQVHKDLKAADAKKKAAIEQINRTAYHNQYGVQDKNRFSSQSVGQSNSQSKRGAPPAKRGKFGESRSDPAGTPQNNYSNLQGPYGVKSYGYQGPQSHSTAKKPSGLANPTKGKVFQKPIEQGLGGINKLHDRKAASAPQYPPPSESNRTPRTSTPHPQLP